MKNKLLSGQVLHVELAAAVKSGDGLLIGNLFGVACTDGAAGDAIAVEVEGVFRLPKTTGAAWSDNQNIYWNATSGRCTGAASGNTLIGIAYQDATSTATTGQVRLNGAVATAAGGGGGAAFDGTLDGGLSITGDGAFGGTLDASGYYLDGTEQTFGGGGAVDLSSYSGNVSVTGSMDVSGSIEGASYWIDGTQQTFGGGGGGEATPLSDDAPQGLTPNNPDFAQYSGVASAGTATAAARADHVHAISRDNVIQAMGPVASNRHGYMRNVHLTKLDGIEENAKDDQTADEIRTLVGEASSSESGFMSTAQHDKLDGVEENATADQSGTEIVSAIDAELGGSTWQQVNTGPAGPAGPAGAAGAAGSDASVTAANVNAALSGATTDLTVGRTVTATQFQLGSGTPITEWPSGGGGGGGSAAEPVVLVNQTTASTHTTSGRWHGSPAFSRALTADDDGKWLYAECRIDGEARSWAWIPVSTYRGITEASALGADNSAANNSHAYWGAWATIGAQAYRRSAFGKISDSQIAWMSANGSSYSLRFRVVLIDLGGGGAAAVDWGALTETIITTGGVQAANIQATEAITGNNLILTAGLTTGGQEIVGNSTTHTVDLARSDLLQLGRGTSGTDDSAKKGLIAEFHGESQDNQFILFDPTNDKVEVAGGNLASPTLMRLDAGSFHGAGAAHYTQWLHAVHGETAEVGAARRFWDTRSFESIYGPDSYQEYNQSTLLELDGTPVDAIDVILYNRNAELRGDSYKGGRKKFVFGPIESSSNGNASIAGISFNAANSPRGDVDAWDNEYKYRYGVNIDTSSDPHQIVEFPTGEHGQTPLETLVGNTVFTLQPGTWRIGAFANTVFSASTRANVPNVELYMVASGKDDVLLSEAFRIDLSSTVRALRPSNSASSPLIHIDEASQFYVAVTFVDETTLESVSSGVTVWRYA